MCGSRPRFFCDTLGCPQRIFVDPWARQPECWRQALLAWVWDSSAKVAARSAAKGSETCRVTFISLPIPMS
jgi:hypothetical protein